MSVQIYEVTDQKRICGWRVEEGWYAVSGRASAGCGKMPLRLDPCECCGLTLKLTRSLQKINVQRLFGAADCTRDNLEDCRDCLVNRTGYGYLMGVGKKYSRHSFLAEAAAQGVSKRIPPQLPRGFKVGQSVVLLGHPKVFTEMVDASEIEPTPIEIDDDAPAAGLPLLSPDEGAHGQVARDIGGVICLFIPQQIQYVVSGRETQSQLEALANRGLTLVRVTRAQGQPDHPTTPVVET